MSRYCEPRLGPFPKVATRDLDWPDASSDVDPSDDDHSYPDGVLFAPVAQCAVWGHCSCLVAACFSS